MSILLEVHPGEAIPPEDFLLLPKDVGHIALDGAVSGPTFVLPGDRKASYNHHEGSRRLATGSAAMQLLMGVRMGELDAFEGPHDGLDAVIRTIDCDQDVGVAVALARRYEQLRYGNPDPVLDNFVDAVGKLDITNGAYPMDPNSPLMRRQAWIFLPYTRFVEDGGLRRRDPREYETVIDSIDERFEAHLAGRGGEHTINLEIIELGGGQLDDRKKWLLFSEVKSHEGRIGAFQRGVRAYGIVRQLDEDRWQYTVGRTSEGIDWFDVPGLYKHLNRIENCEESDCWGGSDLIGGSPRLVGSQLSPAELEREINAHLHGQCACPSSGPPGRDRYRM